jgi:MFS transporter, SP family, general alpha glucoside:H+ symporter
MSLKNSLDVVTEQEYTEHQDRRPTVIEETVPAKGSDAEYGSLFKEVWAMKKMIPYLLIIYVAIINIGIDAAMGGLSLGIPAFRRQFGYFLSEEAGYAIKATYTSAWSGGGVAGQFFGAIIAGWMADRFGRNWTLRVSCVITIISTIIQLASRTIGPLIVGKIMFGFGTGFLTSQAAPYLAELSPARLRGVVIMGVNVFLVVGQWMATGLIWICASAFPNVMSNTSWLLLFSLQLIFPCIYLAASFWLPESPVFLVQNGNIEQARINAQRLYGSKYDYNAHIDKIVLEIEAENALTSNQSKSTHLIAYYFHVQGGLSCTPSPALLLTGPSTAITFWEPVLGTNRRRTLIGIMVIVGQVLTGDGFILSYQNYFYELAGISGSNALTFGNYSVALFANICSYFVIDYVGRRPLYIYGAFVLSFANFLVGFMSLVQPTQPAKAGDIAVLGLYLWSFTYQSTTGPTAWALAGEIGSNRLRAKTNSWIGVTNSLIGFGFAYAIPELFQPNAANLGLKMGYIFGSTTLCLAVLCWFCLPETKARTAWELDRLFEAKVPARRFKKAQFGPDSALVEESVGGVKV